MNNKAGTVGCIASGLAIFVFCISIDAWAEEQSAQQAPAGRTATVTPPSPRPDSGTPKSIPESESQMRQLLTDTNRKIDELEVSIKDWTSVIGSLQEKQQSVPTVPTDFEPLLRAVDQAAASKNANRTFTAIQALYNAFFGVTLSFTYYPGTYDNSDRFSNPASPARWFLSKVQNQINAIIQKAYTPINDWNTSADVDMAPLSPERSRPVIPAPARIAELKQIYAAVRQKTYFDSLASTLGDAVRSATEERDKAVQERNAASALRDQINTSIDKGKKEINQLAIQLGLPLFCGTVLLLFSIPFFFQRKQEADPRQFQYGTLVEISTVLLLTMSILILGLAQKLDGPVLGTLLGGISGYVLNRVRTPNAPNTGDPAASP